MLADTASTNQTDPNALIKMLGVYAIIAVGFYLVLIRPQQKRAKELAKLVDSIKSGDRVGTSSGIIGTVISVKDKIVTLRSADSKLEVAKSAITEILEANNPSAN